MVRNYSMMQTVAALNGAPRYLGTIVATTTSKNNHTTATPFNDTGLGLAGKTLEIQPDTACYFILGTTNAVTAATTACVYLDALEKYPLTPRSDDGWIACVAVSGTTNLNIFEKG